MAQPKYWDGVDMFERMKADPYRIPICRDWPDDPLFGFGRRMEPYGNSNFDAWCYLVTSNFVDMAFRSVDTGKFQLSCRPNTTPDGLCPIWNWSPKGVNAFIRALHGVAYLTDELAEKTIKQIDWRYVPRWPQDAVAQPTRRERLPKSLRLTVLEKTSGLCVYCGVNLVLTPGKPNSFHADHVLPVEKGGSDDIANLVPACATCNGKKAAKTALQFLNPGAA